MFLNEQIINLNRLNIPNICLYKKRKAKQHSNLINDNTSIKYVLQYPSQNQVFIIVALLYPVGQ